MPLRQQSTIGVDKDSELASAIKATSANVHDVSQASSLLTGEENVVHGDSGYWRAEKREDAIVRNTAGRKIKHNTNRCPSQDKKLSDSGQYAAKLDYSLEGCGQLELHMDVEQGTLRRLHIYGDYFTLAGPEELAGLLLDCPLEEQALRRRLEGVEPGRYLRGMDADGLCRLLLS